MLSHAGIFTYVPEDDDDEDGDGKKDGEEGDGEDETGIKGVVADFEMDVKLIWEKTDRTY